MAIRDLYVGGGLVSSSRILGLLVDTGLLFLVNLFALVTQAIPQRFVSVIVGLV